MSYIRRIYFCPDKLSCEKGVNVLIEMNKKKVGKCFEYAERENIKYVMVIGENEINNKVFKIKDMVKKEEQSFEYEELIKYLTK